ncbi:MAG TPA: hypothetical protein VN813_12960 [Luteibacter sp.]|jgi:hypothetical protein|nr:hypothetical protein [Luteibacter sp.]
MSASWKTVYEGQHEGRSITVKESGDGTFKVLTRQDIHDEGIAYQDGKTFVHISPSSKGEQVESEVNSRDSLKEALKELHFSAETVSSICDQLH